MELEMVAASHEPGDARGLLLSGHDEGGMLLGPGL